LLLCVNIRKINAFNYNYSLAFQLSTCSDRRPPGVGRGRGRGREEGAGGRQGKGIGRGVDDAGGRGMGGGRGRGGSLGRPGGNKGNNHSVLLKD
jgi:hypothetical protein